MNTSDFISMCKRPEAAERVSNNSKEIFEIFTQIFSDAEIKELLGEILSFCTTICSCNKLDVSKSSIVEKEFQANSILTIILYYKALNNSLMNFNARLQSLPEFQQKYI